MASRSPWDYGRLEVFAIGTDRALNHIWQTAPNGAWSGWSGLAGGIVELAVGRNADGRLEVFAIGTDKALNHIPPRPARSRSPCRRPWPRSTAAACW